MSFIWINLRNKLLLRLYFFNLTRISSTPVVSNGNVSDVPLLLVNPFHLGQNESVYNSFRVDYNSHGACGGRGR